MSIADSPGMELPGVWNIVYLCAHKALAPLLSYDGDPAEFPVRLAITPAVVGTSLQSVNGKTLGEWAEELGPAEWLDKAKTLGKDLLLEAVYPGWLSIADIPERTADGEMGELIQVDFGRKNR